ncbi:MAG: SDR family NAD(P)-dependent oxidoreductase [Hellea sp.]
MINSMTQGKRFYIANEGVKFPCFITLAICAMLTIHSSSRKIQNMSHPSKILITGATSGLGWEMTQQFAARGDALIASGRNQAKLGALGDFEGVEARHLDMSSSAAISEFCSPISALSGLILNAGVTYFDRFETGNFETDAALVQTNVTANLQLIRELLPALKAGNGRILIIASVGGLIPLPYQAVYSGSKAFMINLGLALREELKAEGIRISVFAPGGIKTEMTNIAGMKGLEKELAPVSEVAAAALRAYDKMPPLTIPGAQNKLAALMSKLLPRSFLANQAGRIYKKSIDQVK